jgi:hypothetical protein
MRSHGEKRRRIPDAARKKNFIGLRITDEELSALESLADQENLSVAHFVREGIRLVIEKRVKQ